MVDLKSLSVPALGAAMRGGTAAWGQWGSTEKHIRYCEPLAAGNNMRRRKCRCGCSGRKTHGGFANGVVLMAGCELSVRRWVKTGR